MDSDESEEETKPPVTDFGRHLHQLLEQDQKPIEPRENIQLSGWLGVFPWLHSSGKGPCKAATFYLLACWCYPADQHNLHALLEHNSTEIFTEICACCYCNGCPG